MHRPGTSYHEFERYFDDSESCLGHIFASRLAGSNLCPNCGKQTEFVRVTTANRFMSKCCYTAHLYPLRDTIFSGSQISLIHWFRAILYFTNTSSGISPNFIAQQLGIGVKASIRMCSLIREHLSAIDEGICLGNSSRPVHVAETTMKAIARQGQKNGVRYRILMAGDGVDFFLLPIATGKFAKSRDRLLDRLHPSTTIITETPQLRLKLLNYKYFSKLKGRQIRSATDSDFQRLHELSVCSIALKRFILRSHYWVSEQHLPAYMGHFAFLYRRRHRRSEAFWDAVSSFPPFTHVSPGRKDKLGCLAQLQPSQAASREAD